MYSFHTNLQSPITHVNATTRVVYKALVSNHTPPSSQQNWEEILDTSPQWDLVWKNASHKSMDKYLCDLNWRILNRALRTNSRLFKMGIITNQNCDICKTRPEDLLHCFTSCFPLVVICWRNVKQVSWYYHSYRSQDYYLGILRSK